MTEQIEINFEADASVEGPTDAQLSLISLLARGALDLEKEMQEAALHADNLAKAYNKIVREELPDAMRAAGVSEYTLTDGSRVQVVREVRANISSANANAAHSWLREHGYGDLIKDEVTARFNAGEDDAASELYAQLSDKYNVARKESVHGSTLKAFVREQLTEGAALPSDIFGIFEYDIAKIKPAKV